MLNPTDKFGAKAEEGFFVGYSTPNKRVFNKLTQRVKEWPNVDVQRYTQNAPSIGPDWMFYYKDLFESFHLESLIEEAVAQMYYEWDNAANLPLVRPITVNTPATSNDIDAPVVEEEEIFQEASTTLDTSSPEEDEEISSNAVNQRCIEFKCWYFCTG